MPRYDVAIVGGFGHVGLPFGIALAETRRSVLLVDINSSAFQTIADGKMPFMEEAGEESLQRVLGKNLFLSLDETDVSDCHYLVIVLGTPVDEHLNPNFSGFLKFFERLLPLLRNDQHVILRSTVYPGATEQVKRMIQRAGLKTSVSFCPERILQGKALHELRNLPQIIGSFDDTSARDAASLFSGLAPKTIFLSPLEAELAKLFTNSFRYIQFAIANQFYQICVENSVDFYKLYQAAKSDYPRMESWPSAGFAAGPCLFKDTMQLAASCNNFWLGHAAMLINEGIPNLIVNTLKKRCQLSEKTVAILGMAFKGNIDDTRESLSYKLKKLLMIEARTVLCSDPFVPDDRLVPLSDALEKADIIVIGAPHKLYKNLKIDQKNKIVVDVWNLLEQGGLF